LKLLCILIVFNIEASQIMPRSGSFLGELCRWVEFAIRHWVRQSKIYHSPHRAIDGCV